VITWYDFHQLYYDNPGEWGHTGPSIHKSYTIGLSLDSTHYNFTPGDENDSDSDHTLTWGAEVKNDRVDSTDIGNHQDLNGAIFIQDVWQPAEEEDLIVTAGLRYDFNQTYGGQFNPRIGFAYQLQDEINFHASVGRAYRAPTYDDLYWPEDAYVGGNPDLIPETAWAYEAGLRFMNEEGDTQAELNIFRKNVSHLINWATDSEGIWRPSNIGSARVDGIEVLLKKEFEEHLLGNLNYTYLNTRDLDTDAQLKPKHKFGFGLTYYDQVGDHEDDFTIGLDGYIVSGRPDDLESYCLCDVNISRELTIDKEDGQKVRLNFSVKNLLNQHPELVSGYPIQERTFMVGISTEF
jgi:outer membrane cobalamin receptor